MKLAIPRNNKPDVPIPDAPDDMIQTFLGWYKSPDRNEATREKWKAVAAAAEDELERRKQSAGTGLAKRETSFALISEPSAISARLAKLASQVNLVTPVSEVDHVPEGFGVQVSMVHVDPRPDSKTFKGAGDVYAVGGGKVGLAKQSLERIAAAAGVHWHAALSGRLDDGSDPRYVHYRAVGSVKNFDGTSRPIDGEVELDYRDGSDQVNEIRQKAKQRAERFNQANDGGDAQLLEKRKFILREAQTKAKLRGIASMGVKRAYWPAELDKPFAVARLTFTGQTDDPELRRQFSLMAAQSALGGAAALFGPAPPAPALPPGGHVPPPVGSVEADAEEIEGEPVDAAESFPEGERMREPGDDSEELPT